MKTVSVIVPTLNEADNIGACLGPLQRLRGNGHEVIVVDGGSVDDTCSLAKPLADCVLGTPRGRAAQMNAGAKIARGQVLVFLHADSRLPDELAEFLSRVSERECWGRFDVRIDGRPRMLKLIAALMNWRSRLTGIATGDQAIFVDRAWFERVGGFPDQPLMEDVHLSARLRAVAKPICLRATVTTSGRRWEKHGIWRTIAHMWRLRWAYYRGVDPAVLAQRYPAHKSQC